MLKRFLLFTTISLANLIAASAQQTITENDIEYILHDDGTATVSKVYYYDWKDHYVEIPATIKDYYGSQYQVTTFGNDSPVFDLNWHGISNVQDWYGQPWYEDNDFLELHPSRLDSIALPETITKIGKLAFAGCNSLTSFYMPEDVEFVDSCAFIGCYNLKEVHTPNIQMWTCINFVYSVSSATCCTSNPLFYAHQLFENDKKISDISFTYIIWGQKPSATILGDNAFYCWDGVTAEFAAAVARIGCGVFANCTNLESVVIKSFVADSIGCLCFNNCRSLKNIQLPESLKRIGRLAFQDCQSLTSIKIPNKVNTVEDHAFWLCKSLQYINMPDYITALNSYTFGYCTSLNDIYIPSSVSKIGEGVFYHCDSLSAINIPESVLSIGRATFYNCKNLRSISFDDAEEKLTYNNNIENQMWGDSTLFGNSPIERIYFGRNISESFRGSLNKLPTLKTLEFGGGATEILPEMFSDCTALEEVTLSKSIRSIGSKAFASANNISRISVDAEEPPMVAEDTFSPDIYATAELSVPTSSLERYKTAPIWQNFIKITGNQGSVAIYEIEANGITIEVVDGAVVVNGAKSVKVYNVSGAEVYSGAAGCIELPAGIYVVAADSQTKKIRI